MSPRNRLRFSPRPALSPGDEGTRAAPPSARLPNDFQFGRSAHQSSSRAHPGDWSACPQSRFARWPHARDAGREARLEENEKGEPQLKAARITPEMAGLPRATIDQFTGGDLAANKELLYDVITGTQGGPRDVVLLNTAAVLVAAGLAGDLKQGVAMGVDAIDSGQAAATLAKLQQFGAKHATKSN